MLILSEGTDNFTCFFILYNKNAKDLLYITPCQMHCVVIGDSSTKILLKIIYTTNVYSKTACSAGLYTSCCSTSSNQFIYFHASVPKTAGRLTLNVFRTTLTASVPFKRADLTWNLGCNTKAHWPYPLSQFTHNSLALRRNQ